MVHVRQTTAGALETPTILYPLNHNGVRCVFLWSGVGEVMWVSSRDGGTTTQTCARCSNASGLQEGPCAGHVASDAPNPTCSYRPSAEHVAELPDGVFQYATSTYNACDGKLLECPTNNVGIGRIDASNHHICTSAKRDVRKRRLARWATR